MDGNKNILKMFSKDGLDRFRDQIKLLQKQPDLEFDLTWIHDNFWTKIPSPEVEVQDRVLVSKLDIAQTLTPIIKQLYLPDKFYNPFLWGWLSAFYFDSICPLNSYRIRKPGKMYRYIPPNNRNWRTVYRHLLAGPVRLYDIHGIDIKILFHAPSHTLGDFMEQLASRQEIAASQGVLEAADLLYWDLDQNQPKVGARSTGNKAGTLRRFVSLIQQFMMTYDVYSLDAKHVIKLLPENEFTNWL